MFSQMSTDLEDEERPGFWFDSLVHAREWITGTTTMNIINYVRTCTLQSDLTNETSR